MKIRQTLIRHLDDITARSLRSADFQPALVLVFGSIDLMRDERFLPALQAAYPQAQLAGCSTAGEISPDGVDTGSCVITAIEFSSTRIHTVDVELPAMSDSCEAGKSLGHLLPKDGLRGALVFGPGVDINGCALINGLTAALGDTLPITGGLAGDNGAFASTLVLGPGGIHARRVVAIGLYGDHVTFSHGSYGGWEPFGPARKITRSDSNILYELDGQPALEIYKRYLGEYARDLPASGLLFPFALLGTDHHATGLIRTILDIDEENGALILAGEIDPDGYLKLMHASTDKLVAGAERAAQDAGQAQAGENQRLAILVSCVGRKLVMGARVDEEIDAVADLLGKHTVLTGFYSYGELSPLAVGESCKLHNQTMTISLLGED